MRHYIKCKKDAVNKKCLFFYAFYATVIMFPTYCTAHTVSGKGFFSGIIHPILGIDHLFAMFCVGIVSTLIGKNYIWILPVEFVAVMVFGGGVALSNVFIPGQELGIVLSVLVFGVAIAFGRKAPVIPSILIVALFAFFHGYAHGAEIPDNASTVVFIIGFSLGTAVIHLAGVFFAHFLSKNQKSFIFLRFAGAFFCGVGFHMLLSLVS